MTLLGVTMTLYDSRLAFLDVRKAFDSVSHESMVNICRREGFPEPFLAYLQRLYKESTTQLKVAGELSEPISVGQGVKQGDPLSGCLFNMVVDWALESVVDSKIGFRIGNQVLNHLAFADDVVLLAETPAGLQSLTNAFQRAFTGPWSEPCSSTDSDTLSIFSSPTFTTTTASERDTI